MGRFLVRFVVPLLVALAVALGAGLLAYGVSMHKEPILLDASTAVPMAGDYVSLAAETNVLSLCIVCSAYAAVTMFLFMLALGCATRRSRGRRHERQIALLKSKLVERDEEIARLQSRLRGGDTEEPPHWSGRSTLVGVAADDVVPAPEPSSP